MQNTSQSSSTSRTPNKSTFHPSFQQQSPGAPQAPPKKGAAIGRGVPPPIPPNKPVIPTKQTPARRPDNTEPDKKKNNMSSNKDTTIQDPARAPGPGIEMLGQELADFQQMFVTMATSNNT